MAELRIYWADGRSEIRALLPAQLVTVGDGRLPVLPGNEEIPVGGTVQIGRVRQPFCRVRVHGDELPEMALLAASRGHEMALPSARRKR